MITITRIITIAGLLSATPAGASEKHHLTTQRAPMAADFYALSTPTPRNAPVDDGSCIGLSSGTSAPSCGATLTGGPAGGLD